MYGRYRCEHEHRPYRAGAQDPQTTVAVLFCVLVIATAVGPLGTRLRRLCGRGQAVCLCCHRARLTCSLERGARRDGVRDGVRARGQRPAVRSRPTRLPCVSPRHLAREKG
jgi:hypothetical protein